MQCSTVQSIRSTKTHTNHTGSTHIQTHRKDTEEHRVVRSLRAAKDPWPETNWDNAEETFGSKLLPSLLLATEHYLFLAMPVPTKLAPDITDKSHCNDNDNDIDNDNYGDDSNYDDDNNDDDENSEQDNDNSCTSSIMHNSDNNTLDASRCKADDNSCISDMSSLSSIKSFGKNAALDFSKIGLHGRSQETSILLDAYHRISKEGHRSQLVGIKGESGSGKSALVENMRQIVTTQDPAGWYIQGKFDPLRQMEALSAIVTAFSELCDFILHSHNFLQIRKNIQEKLGEDTSILENVIPNLFHVTSDNSMDTSTPDQLKQTSLPSSLKLASVIQVFLKAISTHSCPILIHLDDIQCTFSSSAK